MCRLAAPSAFSHFHIFFKFIKTSTIAVSTATLLSFIHYSFLSWQAITTARLQVHYAHMKPITPSGLANSSNIYLLPCEQRVNLPVTLKTVLPLWNKNITLPAPETALMLNLLSNFKTMPVSLIPILTQETVSKQCVRTDIPLRRQPLFLNSLSVCMQVFYESHLRLT